MDDLNIPNFSESSRKSLSQEEQVLQSLLSVLHYRTEDVQSFLDHVLDEAIRISGSKIGYIYLYNDVEVEFVLNTWSKEVMKECAVIEPKTCYALSNTGYWGEAVRQNKPMILNDFAANHPLKKGYPDGHVPLTRFLTLPVLVKNKIVAVVGVANKVEEYNNADILRLQLLMDASWQIVEWRSSIEREQHLNRVLLGIRNVNQLIIKDESAKSLIRRACAQLTGTMGYHHAWITTIDQEGSFLDVASSGEDEAILELKTQLSNGVFPSCFEEVIRDQKLVVRMTPVADCKDCPARIAYPEAAGICVPLLFDGVLYGVLGIAVPQGYARLPEEQDLIREIATDIAFALHNIQKIDQGFSYRDSQQLLIEKMEQGLAIHEVIYDDNKKICNYRFLDLNARFEEYTGLKKEDILGKTVLEVLPETESYWIETYAEVVTTGEPVRYMNYSSALKRHYEVIAYRNKPGQFATLINDVTTRERLIRIQKSQYKIAHAFATSHDLNTLFDATRTELTEMFDVSNFYIAFYNPESDLFSSPYERDENDTIPVWEAEGSLSGLVVREEKALLLREPEIRDLSSRGVIRMVGTPAKCWLGVPVREGDQISGVIVVQSYNDVNAFDKGFLDIMSSIAQQLTLYIQNRKIEDSLRESHEKFRLIAENTGDNITLLDLDLNITYTSPSIQKIRGFSVEEASQHSLSDILLPASLNSIMEVFDNQMRLEADPGSDPNRSVVLELEEYHKDGHTIWVEMNLSFLRDSSGTPIGIVAVSRDVTEKRRIVDELLEAKELAEENDRLKTAFLANMSHEIRTPMNGILGFAELLKNPSLSPQKQQEFIEVIETSGRRLYGLINDLIDISRIEAGQMPVVSEPVKIMDECAVMYSFFNEQAQKKGIELCFLPDIQHQYLTIIADKLKFNSIMNNLISNAIKFTDRGNVSFGYSLKDDFVRFFVNDTGTGIPVNKQERIFKRFEQADNTFARGYEGAGLGLSIAKAYVEMMGGNIGLSSEPGNGSSFWFTLPLTGNHGSNKENSSDSSSDVEGKEKFRKLKILVAEDDEVSRQYLEVVLEDIAGDLTFVASGQEAVDFVKEYPDLDLVLMDIKMYDMDGLQATRLIRQFNQKVVVIAQTAYALSGDRETAITAGCNDYITKPMNKTMLMSVIRNFFTL